ncbi:hypothetical protein GUJ93_ZPchr0011g27733 [Zizania palustris]|uniref:2-isopropylmalate synthase n=1 Tax=Zizania palustris TaxID=103762 RepID=A0A8J5WMH9_ZIZPA|nr:hypothetical protein GUJ93_ZPchr0011g27733 [Zizania palustris]
MSARLRAHTCSWFSKAEDYSATTLVGSVAMRSKLVELGYEITDKEFEDFFKCYKEAAEKKQATCGTLGLSTATVKLIGPDGEEKIACSVGTGPVDAAYKAVDKIIQIPTVLREYSMTSVTEGIDAIATTRVVVTGDVNDSKHALTGHSFNRAFSGSGAAMDIVVSSVRAYLSALKAKLFKPQNESRHTFWVFNPGSSNAKKLAGFFIV